MEMVMRNHHAGHCVGQAKSSQPGWVDQENGLRLHQGMVELGTGRISSWKGWLSTGTGREVVESPSLEEITLHYIYNIHTLYIYIIHNYKTTKNINLIKVELL